MTAAIGLTWGDPWSTATYSGVPRLCFSALEDRGALVGRADIRLQRPIDALGGALDIRRSIARRRPTRSAVWRYLPENIERLTTRFALVESSMPEHDAVLQFGVAGLPRADARLVAHVEIPVSTAASNPVFSRSYGFDRLPRGTLERAVLGERYFLERCSTVWTNTPFTAERLVADGLEPAKIFVHPPGCGTADPGPIERDLSDCSVLFVGKDWAGKGGPLLLEAFRILRRELPGARLTVVGCHPRIGPEPGVDVLGYLDKGDPRQARRLEDAWRRATIFCLPSHWESTGIVYMEAMLYQLPVVMLRGQGRDEVFPEDIAHHLDQPEPEELARLLADISSDPDECRRRGEAGRRLVNDRYTWPVVAERLEAQLAGRT